jgi:hypothetical protein
MRSEGRGAVGLNEDAPAVADRTATTTATAADLRRMEQVISGKSRLRGRGVVSGCVRTKEEGSNGWMGSFVYIS